MKKILVVRMKKRHVRELASLIDGADAHHVLMTAMRIGLDVLQRDASARRKAKAN